MDAARLVEQGLGFMAKAFFQQTAFVDAAFQRFRDDRGLLEDFLQHVMFVGALVGGGGRQLRQPLRPHHRVAGDIEHAHAIAPDFGHIAFFQEDEALGDRQQREHIRGNEVFTDAESDHQGAAGAGDDQSIRFGRGGNRQTVGADQLGDRLLHRTQ